MDDLLLHPNMASTKITKYETEAKQGLASEIDNVMNANVSTVFTTDMTTED